MGFHTLFSSSNANINDFILHLAPLALTLHCQIIKKTIMIDTSAFQGKKAAYFTLGCKLNFSETSTFGRLLHDMGVTTHYSPDWPCSCHRHLDHNVFPWKTVLPISMTAASVISHIYIHCWIYPYTPLFTELRSKPPKT